MACRFELIFIAYSWLRKFPCRPFQSAEIHCLSASIKRETGAGKLGFAPLPQSFCLKSDHLHPSNWPFSPLELTIFAHQNDLFETKCAVGILNRPYKIFSTPICSGLCARRFMKIHTAFEHLTIYSLTRHWGRHTRVPAPIFFRPSKYLPPSHALRYHKTNFSWNLCYIVTILAVSERFLHLHVANTPVNLHRETATLPYQSCRKPQCDIFHSGQFLPDGECAEDVAHGASVWRRRQTFSVPLGGMSDRHNPLRQLSATPALKPSTLKAKWQWPTSSSPSSPTIAFKSKARRRQKSTR